MSYDIRSIPPFDRQLKRLIRKFPSLKNEFALLIDQLEKTPDKGTALGKGCYKIHLAIRSKGKGRSGGARVITNFVISQETVYLLSIYDKSSTATLTDKELKELLKFVSD